MPAATDASTSEQPPKGGNGSVREPPDPPSPASDWRRSQFGLFFKAADYWRDRRSFLSDPLIIITDHSRLKTKSFSYALTAVLLPSLVLAAALGGVQLFANLPKTQIDRALEQEQSRQKVLEDLIPKFAPRKREVIDGHLRDPSLGKVSEADLKKEESDIFAEIHSIKNELDQTPHDKERLFVLLNRLSDVSDEIRDRSYANIAKHLALAQEESQNNYVNLLRINKLVTIVSYFKNAIVGLGLICNAYMFTWLIARLRPEPKNISAATDAHLYSLGTALFFPAVIASLIYFFLDMSIRFDISWYYENVQYLNLLVVL